MSIRFETGMELAKEFGICPYDGTTLRNKDYGHYKKDTCPHCGWFTAPYDATPITIPNFHRMQAWRASKQRGKKQHA